jgi:hypothetical protein
MGLGMDLTLLSIDEKSGSALVGMELSHALAIGELVDLAVSGRIMVRGELIEILDRSPVGEGLTDESLARIADIGQGLSVEQWLEQSGRGRRRSAYHSFLYEKALVDSWAGDGGPDWIEIAGTEQIEAVADRLRTLIADERGPSSVQDLAFIVLADATGWPQTHLDLETHRDDRERLRRLTEKLADSAAVDQVEEYEGDAAFAVLRQGVRAATKLARTSLLSGEHGGEPEIGRSRSRDSRRLRLVMNMVALLALATLVLACMENVGLAIVTAPFTVGLIGLPVVDYAARHDRRRKAAKPVDGSADTGR